MTELTLTGIRAAVVTISDGVASGAREDRSGPALAALAQASGAELRFRRVVADESPAIEACLRDLAAECDLILTTGGTGLGPRDHTPEATAKVCARRAQGLEEYLRQATSAEEPRAWLSRGLAGIAGPLASAAAGDHYCLIINFPGSPRAVEQYWRALARLLPHAMRLILGHTEHGTLKL